jgi:ribonuclease VapC
MIVDTSAVIAILRDEPDCARLAEAIRSAQFRRMSAATYVETSIVVDASRDPVLSRRLDELLAEADIVIEPLTEAQAHLARAAYRDFGRGSGHPARLDLGDCFSYALAKDRAEPLLFKGDDFVHTDIVPA